MRLRRPRAVWTGFFTLALMACGATSATEGPPPPMPSGWIYSGAFSDVAGQELRRVNVATGFVERVPFTDAFPPIQRFLLQKGAISPVDGRLSAHDFLVGEWWPRTFVYDPSTGVVEKRGDPGAMRDKYHTWSPDGRAVVFVRHAVSGGDGRMRLVRLTVGTGISDTLYVPPRPESFSHTIRWLGTDSLVLNYTAYTEGSPYMVLDLKTGTMTPFTEVEFQGFTGLQAFSASGEWMANWIFRPDTPDPSRPDSLLLELHHRGTGEAPRIARRELIANGHGTIDVAFSPDEQFFATCPSYGTVVIQRVSDLATVAAWPVPWCSALSWSLK